MKIVVHLLFTTGTSNRHPSEDEDWLVFMNEVVAISVAFVEKHHATPKGFEAQSSAPWKKNVLRKRGPRKRAISVIDQQQRLLALGEKATKQEPVPVL
ncbi:unnamed protein product, partial [Thelazia callipaeda]|uniref:Uncharacterized protein n=1 Tax=Thelazia callipaeda TaxID=103827 RepID=A0A0N5CTK9_THECL